MNSENTIHTVDVINTDYNAEDLPESVKKYHPVVYKDGDEYCCILGPNPQDGIFGSGSNVQEAVMDWDSHYRDYMADADEEDIQLIRSWANRDM